MATTIFPWISCISQVHAEVCFFFCLDLDAFPLSTISENVLANNFAKRTVSVTFLLYAQEGEAAKLKWCLCCPVRVNDRLLWKNKLLWKSSSEYSRLDYCLLSMTKRAISHSPTAIQQLTENWRFQEIAIRALFWSNAFWNVNVEFGLSLVFRLQKLFFFISSLY